MQMTNEEILVNFNQAKNPAGQVKILAELNATSVANIKRILIDQGVDPRKLPRAPRKPTPAINEKQAAPSAKPAPVPVPAADSAPDPAPAPAPAAPPVEEAPVSVLDMLKKEIDRQAAEKDEITKKLADVPLMQELKRATDKLVALCNAYTILAEVYEEGEK